MPEKKSEKLRENETIRTIRQLGAYILKVREDIANKKISEADGQKLISKAASMLKNTHGQTFPE